MIARESRQELEDRSCVQYVGYEPFDFQMKGMIGRSHNLITFEDEMHTKKMKKRRNKERNYNDNQC